MRSLRVALIVAVFLCLSGSFVFFPVTADTPPIHQNPDDISDDTAADVLSGALDDRMSDQLNDSATDLDTAEYQRASEILGGDTQEELATYIEIAGDADDPDYGDLPETQQQLADLLETYDAQLNAYEAARDAGDFDTAREHATQLNETATQLQTTNRQLNEQYGALDDAVDTDLGDTYQEINRTITTLVDDARTIADQELVHTEMTVQTTSSEPVSYESPLSVTGTVTTADGEPVTDGEVVIAEPAGETTASVDDSGEFALTYQPRLIDADTEQLNLTYRADTTDPFQQSTATIDVDITQVTGNISISDTPDALAFGETFTANVSATVSGEPIEQLPVSLTLGSDQYTGETGHSGHTTVTGTHSPDVSPGDQTVYTDLPDDTAVTVEPDSAPVTVTATDTDLSVTSSDAGDDTLVVGTLTTDSDDPVPDATVAIRETEPETELTTVTTDQSGTFETVISEDDLSGETLTVVYDDQSTNLNATTATVDVSADSNSWIMLTAAGILLVSVAGVALRVRRRNLFTSDTATPQQSSPELDSTVEQNDQSATSRHLQDKLAQVSTDELPPQATVLLTYALVRTHLEQQYGGSSDMTHWEFYRHFQDQDYVESSALEPLKELTEAYEHTAFTSSAPTADEANQAFELASEIATQIDTTDTSDQ